MAPALFAEARPPSKTAEVSQLGASLGGVFTLARMKKKLPWILGALAIAVALFVAAPYIYRAARGGDDAPAAAVVTEGAEAPTVELDGTWTVVPGEPPNTTAAGYTVDEILRGEPVTVVGSTDQVTGEARIEDNTLTEARFEVQVAGIATDSSSRDSQFRGPDIADASTYPTATIVLAEPAGPAEVPDDGSTTTIPVEVDLTVKGTTVRKPVDVTVLRSGEQLIASGAIPMEWTEVGVEPPNLGFVTVDPTGTIDFLVSLEKS